MPPKILVGCPTADVKQYCLEMYADGLKALTYKNKDILLADNSQSDGYSKEIAALGIPVARSQWFERARDRITTARNLLRDKVLNGYDYFFSLEQDVIPPPDAIERLLSHNKPMVAGVYAHHMVNMFGQQEVRPLVWMDVSEQEFQDLMTNPRFKGTDTQRRILSGELKREEMHAQLDMAKMNPPRLLQVKFTGLGCMLIHRSVLEKVSFAHSDKSFDDYVFAMDCKRQGFPVFLDTGVRCKHITQENAWSGITY